MNDLPPRKTLVLLYRSLQYAQTDLERREIVQSARLVRRALASVDTSLPALARRILTKCAGKTLNSRAIAMACGKSPGGSTIKKAIRALVAQGEIQKIGASQYVIPAKIHAE